MLRLSSAAGDSSEFRKCGQSNPADLRGGSGDFGDLQLARLEIDAKEQSH